jgi:hypothetical protein
MLFQPAPSLSLTEAHVFSAIQALGQSFLLLLACHSSSPGCVLARLWAGNPKKVEPNIEAIQSKSLAKTDISAFLAEIWHKEISQWRNYSTVFPRSFLCCLALAPSLKCSDVPATVRTLRSQLPSASLWFLCLLRLACGHSLESIPNFLLDCPNFSQLRQYLFLTTSANGFRLSSMLSTFPKCIPLWHALDGFITKSKHLVLKQASAISLIAIISGLVLIQVLLPSHDIHNIALAIRKSYCCFCLISSNLKIHFIFLTFFRNFEN